MADPSEGELGFILDTRDGPSDHAFWWRPQGAGYTSNLDEAGLYSRAGYERRISTTAERAAAAFVPREVAMRAARRTVLFQDLGVKPEATRRQELRDEAAGAALQAVLR